MKDKKHLARVAKLPCCICREWNETVVPHHRTGAGMGRKDCDYNTMPLCYIHHTAGGLGVAVHAGEETWEGIYGTQDSFIAETQAILGIKESEKCGV